jgi:glycosyltransferase involved in cell wall biosynthesis
MGEPTVSVVIAAYNCAAFLRDAVESVRRQTYQDYEVVVVDDGSTDDTWAVIEELQRAWPALRGIRAPHGGTPVNKNRGIAAARGQWIALLDADDMWKPDKLQRCMAFLAAHPDLSIVYTPMDAVRMDGTPMVGHSKQCHGGQIMAKLFHSIFVHDPAVVFHRRVVEACGGLDESIPVGSGHEFWLRVATKFEYGLIDEPLAVRRWHEQSLTRSNRTTGSGLRAAMLERFYLQHAHEGLLPRRPAQRRLSRVFFKAGRAQMRAGEFARARESFAKAIQYRRANLQAHVYALACRIKLATGAQIPKR